MEFGDLVKKLYESVSEGGLTGTTWYWKKISGGGRGAPGTPSTGECSEQDAVDTALEIVDMDPESVEYGEKEWSLSGDATYTFREDDLIYAGSDVDVFVASPDKSRLDVELKNIADESKKHRKNRSVSEGGLTGNSLKVLTDLFAQYETEKPPYEEVKKELDRLLNVFGSKQALIQALRSEDNNWQEDEDSDQPGDLDYILNVLGESKRKVQNKKNQSVSEDNV